MNNNSLERSSFFEEWLKSWVVENAEILEPVYWFIRCHYLDQDPGSKETNSEGRWMPSYLSGKLIWFPAPVAAFTAILKLIKEGKKNKSRI